MSTVKTVEVVDDEGNKVDVNEEDAGNYKKAPAFRQANKPKKK